MNIGARKSLIPRVSTIREYYRAIKQLMWQRSTLMLPVLDFYAVGIDFCYENLFLYLTLDDLSGAD